ncbi:MAG: hypothetical protein Q4C53_09030 [Clostridia bacterium]|nr:hypothetical protein [Clostridia bacterium]
MTKFRKLLGKEPDKPKTLLGNGATFATFATEPPCGGGAKENRAPEKGHPVGM